jgi:glycosyltransferase involved in cell wall biosynthesis
MRIKAIILTFNESIHLARCIENVFQLTNDILVVDSGSTDDTLAIARNYGVEILSHPWRNYATQFNWALEQVKSDVDWILRIDADEVLSKELITSLHKTLPNLTPLIAGILVNRRMAFMGKPITFGGIFPTSMVRVFRPSRGFCENRWMDEHIAVEGDCVAVRGELLDDNRNSLTWWIAKHNTYASREAIDILNVQYGLIPQDSISRLAGRREAAVKRWVKEHIYNNMPEGTRAFLYFFYRFVIRLGFLDGREGAAFHVLQGLWYRYLVDCKVREVRQHIKANSSHPLAAIREVLGIDVS